MKYLIILTCLLVTSCCHAQDPVVAAGEFIRSLTPAQQSIALYPFDTDERYTFFFVPRDSRKGIAMGELDTSQRKLAMQLLRSCLSEPASQKVAEIIELEKLLKVIEGRNDNDHYRDPRKYYFTVFGVPGEKNTWGWRIEGHHISFHFSVKDKKLVAGTPAFMGSNPGIVKDGPEKGKQILKDETEMGFALVKSFSSASLSKALINESAPNEILTANHRNAMIANPSGLFYAEMTPQQQQHFLQLINVYVHRFTQLFAEDMLRDIQAAGLDNLRFAWAGSTAQINGKAYYYRVQGPSIIIEYDNSQNNANHVHTVLRDLKRDFGGDMLLEHYRKEH